MSDGDSDPLTHEPVTCRHFAYVASLYPGKLRTFVSQFKDEHHIQEWFRGKLSKISSEFYRTLLGSPPQRVQLVEEDHFGYYLASLAESLNRTPWPAYPQPHRATCLMVTASHAVALQLEKKCKDNVISFVARLYEPNDTASLKRVEMLSAQELHLVELEQLWPMAASFRNCVDPPNQPLALISVLLDRDIAPPKLPVTRTLCPSNLYMLLAYGRSDDLQRMLSAAPQGLANLVTILKAKSPDSGLQGFSAAVQQDRTAHAMAYVDFVLAHRQLNSRTKCSLLEANDHVDMSALQCGFRNGALKTVKGVIQKILATPYLSEDEKYHLIACRDEAGCTGLYAALCHQQQQTFYEIAELIANSPHLSCEYARRLLSAESGNMGLPDSVPYVGKK